MSSYGVPDELEVVVDGPVRVVRLNRPDHLNATNHELHRGLAELFPQIDADVDARAVVLTGNGKAFSAGGDFSYLDELSRDPGLRSETLAHGRQIVTGMVGCRVPIVAAVNGPAVGLGCSLVALSDIVYMAETTHLADPHVLMGLVAADGGPVTWPLLISLQLAKEYALTGDRIPAQRAAAIGLVNHVCPDDEVVDQAMACAHRIARLPRRAVEDTKRILNLHLERAVVATLDFALSAEDRSFTSPELRANLDRLLAREDKDGGSASSTAVTATVCPVRGRAGNSSLHQRLRPGRATPDVLGLLVARGRPPTIDQGSGAGPQVGRPGTNCSPGRPSSAPSALRPLATWSRFSLGPGIFSAVPGGRIRRKELRSPDPHRVCPEQEIPSIPNHRVPFR